MKLPGGQIVVDASLLVAMSDREATATRFVPQLRRAVVTAVNFGETLYKLEQISGLAAVTVEATFIGLGVDVVPVSLPVARRFSELKAVDQSSRTAQRAAGLSKGRIKSLSLADIVCLGFAWESGLPVLTGDQHWTTLGPHGLPVRVFDFRDRALTP